MTVWVPEHIYRLGVGGVESVKQQEIIITPEENYPKFECVVIYQLYEAKDVTKISDQSDL